MQIVALSKVHTLGANQPGWDRKQHKECILNTVHELNLHWSQLYLGGMYFPWDARLENTKDWRFNSFEIFTRPLLPEGSSLLSQLKFYLFVWVSVCHRFNISHLGPSNHPRIISDPTYFIYHDELLRSATSLKYCIHSGWVHRGHLQHDTRYCLVPCPGSKHWHSGGRKWFQPHYSLLVRCWDWVCVVGVEMYF